LLQRSAGIFLLQAYSFTDGDIRPFLIKYLYMAWPRILVTSVVVSMGVGILSFISSLIYQRGISTTARMAAADVQAPVISLSHGGGACPHSFPS
jgi:hypothetical protein